MSSVIWDLIERNHEFREQVKYKKINFEAGDVIIKENTKPTLYLILSGTVRVVVSGGKKDKKDDEQSVTSGLADIGPGETIGEMSLYDDHPATADVVASFDCEVVEFDNTSLLKYFKQNPETGYEVLFELLQTLGNRLRAANKAVLRMVSFGIKSS